MSDALRALQDATDAEFNYHSAHDEDGNPVGPETPEADASSPEPEPQPEDADVRSPEAQKLKPGKEPKTPKKTEGKPPTKFQQARTTEQALEDSRQQSKRQKGEIEGLKAQLADLQTKFDQQAKAQAEAQDPIEQMVKQGYRPEDVEQKALDAQAAGDTDGAVAARKVAQQLRARYQEIEQQQQLQASRPNIPGTPEFNAVWMEQEANLVRIENQYGDPEDKELIQAFADKNSDIGQRLQDYLANHPLGIQCCQNNHGIYFAYMAVKNQIKLERRDSKIAKLEKELGRSTALTSLGGSAPASHQGSNGRKDISEMSFAELNRLPMAEYRAALRARSQD